MKRSFDVISFCGVMFTVLGLIFLVVGIFAATNVDYLIEHGSGDVRFLPVIFLGVSSVSLFVGLLVICFNVGSYVKRRRLIAMNDFVLADVIDTVADWSVRVNYQLGFRVVCKFVDVFSGREFTFYSDVLVSGRSDYGPGVSLRVYVDRKRGFRDYYVDTKLR